MVIRSITSSPLTWLLCLWMCACSPPEPSSSTDQDDLGGTTSADTTGAVDVTEDSASADDGELSPQDAAGPDSDTVTTAADGDSATNDGAAVAPDAVADAVMDGGDGIITADALDADTLDASTAEVGDGEGKWTPPPPGPNDLEFEFTGITLQPGQEVIMCYYLPPDGKERWLHAVEAKFEYGLHHLRVDRMYDANTKKAFGPVDCLSGTTHAPGGDPDWYTTGELPGAQDNHMHMQFPAGKGFRVGAKHGLYFEAHVLNTTLKPKKIIGKYHIYTVPKAKVTDKVGLLLAFNNKLSYPPKQTTTQTSSCTFKKPYSLIFGTGHMHTYGTLLEAWINQKKIYTTTDVEDVEITPYVPAIEVKAGDTLTWSCTYNNPTSKPLNVGFSDIYDAMCGFVGFIYPTTDSEVKICE